MGARFCSEHSPEHMRKQVLIPDTSIEVSDGTQSALSDWSCVPSGHRELMKNACPTFIAASQKKGPGEGILTTRGPKINTSC